MRQIITMLTIIGIAAFLAGPGLGAEEEDWVDTGLKLIGKHRYDQAIEAFSTAIEIIPQDYQAYNYRGVARALQGDFEGAVSDYDKALEIRPRYAEAYNNRGFARTRMGDLQQALDDFSRALEINPFFVDAYNNKAWILATAADNRFRNGARAIPLAQKAVGLKPNAESLDTLAAAYAAAGNFESAIDTQKKAVQKLLAADKTSEVPKYMTHLKAYRSQQSLLISYSAAPKYLKDKDSKVSLKKQTKDKFAQAPKEEKMITPPQTETSVATAETKKIKALPLPPKPLPYTIQVSAFRDLQTSNQVAKDLLTKGDRAFTSPVHISGKGTWHRVYIGHYQTHDEAKAAAAGLEKRSFRYVRVTKKPYAVQVGLVGSEKEVQELMSRLQANGYLPYSLPAGTGQNQTRILIGAYESKEAAASLANQLRKDGFKAEILPR